MKYYAYLIGKKSGVLDNWEDCKKIVSGKPGAKYKSFTSKQEAEKWLEHGADYSKKHLLAKKGVYFDAGTGAGNGVEINVTDEKGKSFLKKLLGRDVTNNFGELLALKHALQIAKKENIKEIFGDSRLVVEYWSKGYIKKDNVAEETVKLAWEVKKLRREFETAGGKIELVSGSSNPADLGFHRN